MGSVICSLRLRLIGEMNRPPNRYIFGLTFGGRFTIRLANIGVGIMCMSTGEGFLIFMGVICMLFGIPFVLVAFLFSNKDQAGIAKEAKEERSASKWTYDGTYFRFLDKSIHVSKIHLISVDVATFKWGTSYLNILCEDGTKHRLPVSPKRLEDTINLQPRFALDKAKYNKGGRTATAADRDKLVETLTTHPGLNPKEKDASVVGRAIVGGIIAGEVGAAVGALSAIEKNKKNRES